jgi:hypothetical protein
MKKTAFLLFLLVAQHLMAQKGKEPIKVTDMLQIKQVLGVSLSPDGSKTAFVVNQIEPDGDLKWEYKYSNQIYLACLILRP